MGPAVPAAAADDDDGDDVTLPMPLDECDSKSKLSTNSNPLLSGALTAQGGCVAPSDVIHSDAGESDQAKALGDAAVIGVAYHRPNKHSQHRDEELIQCGICTGMFLSQSIVDHVALCKTNTAEPLNVGDDIFQCKLCDYHGKWYVSHAKQHIAGKPYKCSACSYASKIIKSVRHHCRQTRVCSAKNATLEVSAIGIGCGNCKKVFRTETLFYKHYMEQHVIMLKQFEWCGDCNSWFKVNEGVSHRTKMHSKKYICDVCGKEFKLERLLNDHRLALHSEPTIPCRYCGMKYSTSHGLHRHIKSKHRCSQCGKFYKSPSSLESHVMQQHGPCLELACEVCGKCFKDSSKRRTHMATHSEERPFKCSKCPKSFKSSAVLSSHMVSHTGERKFKCKTCGDAFRQQTHLKYHMLKHTGVRAFPCDHCGKSFQRKQILETHILSHTGERPFSCTDCKKRFLRKTDLNKHLRDFH